MDLKKIRIQIMTLEKAYGSVKTPLYLQGITEDEIEKILQNEVVDNQS